MNWNGWRYTVDACRSLDRSEYRDFRIIIVDNASADDSLAQLRAAVPQADIIANATNAGFSGGCNVGMRRAIELGCGYVFLLNNDATVNEQT
ncbi:MAG: glycosyltransferase, partial [Rhizomicrobium sp.]